MDFELSEEQQMFRDVLRQFVNTEIKPVAREMEQSGQYPHEIVAKMADMGLFGITVGAEYGGLDLDTVSMSWCSRRSRWAGWASPESWAATR